MSRFHTLFFAAGLILTGTLVGCASDVGEGKVKAEIQAPPPAPEKAPEPAHAEPAQAGLTLTLDPTGSKIQALGAKLTGSHTVDFPKFEGTATVAGDQLTGVDVAVDVTGLQADKEKLTGHLLSDDFFKTATFPQATFKSAEIVAEAAEGTTHKITGDMTILGKTNRISFPAKVAVSDTGVEFTTEFVINRQDFGISYPGKPDDLIQDNVAMTIHLVAPKS